MKIFKSIRRILRKVSPKAIAVVATVVAIGTIGAGASFAEFYPNRPTYDYNNLQQRVGSMNGPVFNSFVNTPSYGDERSFVDARRSDQTAAGDFKNELSNVTGGSKEVVIRTYIHNNANQSTNASGVGIARDVKVRVALPTASSQTLRARGYITASNAATVEDTVDMVDTHEFTVEYIPGSATLYNNGPFANGTPLSDSIVTTGAAIGYDALNGNLPGCFDYASVAQIRVKITPKAVPALKLTKEVRLKGDTTWHKSIKTKPGDTVEWLLTGYNSGASDLNHIVVSDVLPPNVSLVTGSVKWIDTSQNAAQSDKPLFDGGIDVGNYAPGGGFYILFATTVKGDFTPCEVTVRNQSFIRSTQTPEDKDTADVVITRENCAPPAEVMYTCDALDVNKQADRTYSYNVRHTAKNATLKSYTYDFGDNTTPLVTDKASVTYTYAKAGKYAVKVTLTFSVNGETKTATSLACATVVVTTAPPVIPQPTTPTTKGAVTTLPRTGIEHIAAIFAATTVGGVLAYQVLARRFTK